MSVFLIQLHPASAARLDTVIVLDRSGSMVGKSSDRWRGAVNAAGLYAEMLRPGDRVAVVLFGQDAQALPGWDPGQDIGLAASKMLLHQRLSELNPDRPDDRIWQPWTDWSSGLARSLEAHPSRQGADSVIVFITDGNLDPYPDPAWVKSAIGQGVLKPENSCLKKGSQEAEISRYGYSSGRQGDCGLIEKEMRTQAWLRINNELMPNLRASRVAVHAVALGDSISRADRDWLAQIAQATGGCLYENVPPQDLPGTFINVFRSIVPCTVTELPFSGTASSCHPVAKSVIDIVFAASAPAGFPRFDRVALRTTDAVQGKTTRMLECGNDNMADCYVTASDFGPYFVFRKHDPAAGETQVFFKRPPPAGTKLFAIETFSLRISAGRLLAGVFEEISGQTIHYFNGVEDFDLVFWLHKPEDRVPEKQPEFYEQLSVDFAVEGGDKVMAIPDKGLDGSLPENDGLYAGRFAWKDWSDSNPAGFTARVLCRRGKEPITQVRFAFRPWDIKVEPGETDWKLSDPGDGEAVHDAAAGRLKVTGRLNLEPPPAGSRRCEEIIPGKLVTALVRDHRYLCDSLAGAGGNCFFTCRIPDDRPRSWFVSTAEIPFSVEVEREKLERPAGQSRVLVEQGIIERFLAPSLLLAAICAAIFALYGFFLHPKFPRNSMIAFYQKNPKGKIESQGVVPLKKPNRPRGWYKPEQHLIGVSQDKILSELGLTDKSPCLVLTATRTGAVIEPGSRPECAIQKQAGDKWETFSGREKFCGRYRIEISKDVIVEIESS